MTCMKRWAIAMALAVGAGSAMARSAEIYEPPSIAWLASADVAPPQLRHRIVAAGQSLGWMVVKDEPGHLELHYDRKGKHQVDIAIDYDASSYRISYLRSVNLNYSEADGLRKIHPNYNRWIRNLMQKISGA